MFHRCEFCQKKGNLCRWPGGYYYHKSCINSVLENPSRYTSRQIEFAIELGKAYLRYKKEQEKLQESALQLSYPPYFCSKHGNIGGAIAIITDTDDEEHYYCKKCALETLDKTIEEACRWENELSKRDFEEIA